MGKISAIEWTDATWNPWYGCTKVSEGCKNCYAERDMKRFGKEFSVITESKTTFRDPLKWKEPRMIFVCSWGDFFHQDVPYVWRQDAWSIMGCAKQHTFLILTKRPENISSMMPEGWFIGGWRNMPNVWIGVSVEKQDYIHRISQLYDIPASKKFVSAEPLLGPLDFSEHMGFIDWVITGGESGPNYRLCDIHWIRSIRYQCIEAGVAFFHKQNGGNRKINGAWGGRELDGRTWDEIPSKESEL